jgi:hypothetical protein
MSRKTIKVVDVIDFVNRINVESGDNIDGATARQHYAVMLEHFLHSTGNYAGYKYLTINEIAHDGTGKLPRPGINSPKYDQDGNEVSGYDRFKDTDPTRVKYIISPKLLEL